MPRSPKFESLKMGEGAHYDPRASIGSLDHNYRYLFPMAIQKRTPEVLIALRRDVWPRYDLTYWKMLSLHTADYLKHTLHPHMAYSWLSGMNPPDLHPKALRALGPLKKSLLLWAETYRVLLPWMLMMALDTLLVWTTYESRPGRIAREASFNRLIDKAFGTDPIDKAEIAEKAHPWGVGRHWYFPKGEDRQFSYAGWAGEDEKEYAQRLLKEFQKHLAPYLREVKDRAKSFPRVPELKRPERFEMLAVYLCRRMTHEQISKTEFHKDSTGIYRDICKAASLIGIAIKKPRW